MTLRSFDLKRILFSLVIFVLFSFPVSGKSTTVILGAFDAEILLLQKKISKPKEIKVQGINFTKGKLENKDVVIACSGMGKVNAAMSTALAIEHFKPKEVIFTGIAGGVDPNLKPGDIVIAEKTIQHDYGRLTPAGMENRNTRNPIDGNNNPVFFPADEKLLEIALIVQKKVQLEKIDSENGPRTPAIRKGVVATGDVFVASSAKCAELRQKHGTDAVEMEGASVAQVCFQMKVPCIIIRSISDNADEKALTDVQKFYKIAAENSASLVEEILKALK